MVEYQIVKGECGWRSHGEKMRKGNGSFNRATGVPRVDIEGYDQGMCIGETRGKLIPRLVE